MKVTDTHLPSILGSLMTLGLKQDLLQQGLKMSKKSKRRIDEEFEFRRMKNVEAPKKQKMKRFLEHAIEVEDWDELEELDEQDRIHHR